MYTKPMEKVDALATPRIIWAGMRWRGFDEMLYMRGTSRKHAIPRSITFFRPILSDKNPRGIDMSMVDIPEVEAKSPTSTTEAPSPME